MATESSDCHERELIFRSLLFFLRHSNYSRSKSITANKIALQLFFRLLREKTGKFISVYPSIILLLSCIPAALSFHSDFGMRWAYFFILVFSAIVLWAVSALRTLQIVLIPAFLITISAQFARPHICGNELAALTKHTSFNAVAKLEIIDPFASEQNNDDFKLREIKCRILSFRYSENEQNFILAHPIKCILNLSNYTENTPIYGDIIEAKGIFRPPPEPTMPDSFNYKQYLALQHIHEIFYLKEIIYIKSGTGLLRSLFQFRDQILYQITSKIKEKAIRVIAMGMLFGGKSAIPRTTKEFFLHSGIIHILTVSGTHVMIVAGLILLLFAPFPPPIRYSLTICIVFFYVLMTGLQGSALRAFTMLGIIFLTRAFSISINSFNSLSIAGFILLLCDPASVMKSGMHYSFLSVTLIILNAKILQKGYLKTSIDYDYILIPCVHTASKFHSFLKNFSHCAKQALMTSFMISFGTSALTLMYQGFFPIQSVFANFLVIPITSFMFIFAFFTYIFHAIPFLGTLFSFLLTKVINVILNIGQFCTTSAFTENLAAPPVWTVFLFLALFFFLLTTVNKKTLFPTVILLILIVIFWHIQGFLKQDEIAVFYGGIESNAHITAVFTNQKLSRADIINLPDSNSAYTIANYLESRGIHTCHMFIASSGRKSSYGGFPQLEELSLPILTATIPYSVLNKFSDSLPHKIIYDKNIPLHSFTDGTFFQKKTSNNAEYFNFHFKKIHGYLSDSDISVYDNTKKTILQKALPYTSKRSFYIQKVPQ